MLHVPASVPGLAWQTSALVVAALSLERDRLAVDLSVNPRPRRQPDSRSRRSRNPRSFALPVSSSALR